MKTRFFLPIFFFVLVVDQVTKWWAEHALSDGSRIPVIGDLLSFVLVYNPGAAFSLGTGSTYLFTIFSVVVLAGIAWVIRKINSKPWLLTLGAIAGGAAGNLIDRLARDPGFGIGHVVDFISYNGYFVGNVADIALVVGVLVVIILEFRSVPSYIPQSKDEDTEDTEDSDEKASDKQAGAETVTTSAPSADTP